MELGLTGKTALVTGGSHGIGVAIAQGLAREGASVSIASRTKERLDQAILEIHAGSGRWPVSKHLFDALEPESVDRLAQDVLEAGGVDILVNNVGGGGRWGTTVLETPLETWDQVYQKNARCAIHLTRALLSPMVQRGWGRVVTISSIHGREAGSNPWFMMAKSAEIALMKGLAMDHSLFYAGVTFNTVAPGRIFIQGKDPEPVEGGPIPLRGTPEDVAAAVVFLCSKQARHINGACLVVDGGESRAF